MTMFSEQHRFCMPVDPQWIRVERGELIRCSTATQQLETDIRTFIDTHNADPKPFRWTKSADDILAAIQRFCTRTMQISRIQNQDTSAEQHAGAVIGLTIREIVGDAVFN
jgi:hypothetical protein